MPSAKNIAFDVEGTLVGYEKFFEAIDQCIGEQLRAHCVKPAVFGMLWIEVSEREYTYLSMSDGYTPYDRIIEAMFWRLLGMIGVKDPRRLASADDLAFILRGFHNMEMRPGAKECIEKLRNAGFTVWGFTMADYSRIHGYFVRAGIDLPEENLLACDSSSIGKPASAAYKPVLEKLSLGGSQPWFAAAHGWDVSAARRQGFLGAYCTVMELEPVPEIFGEMEVIAPTLPEMADQIIAADNHALMS